MISDKIAKPKNTEIFIRQVVRGKSKISFWQESERMCTTTTEN